MVHGQRSIIVCRTDRKQSPRAPWQTSIYREILFYFFMALLVHQKRYRVRSGDTGCRRRDPISWLRKGTRKLRRAGLKKLSYICSTAFNGGSLSIFVSSYLDASPNAPQSKRLKGNDELSVNTGRPGRTSYTTWLDNSP